MLIPGLRHRKRRQAGTIVDNDTADGLLQLLGVHELTGL
jgi:hypothetical protein